MDVTWNETQTDRGVGLTCPRCEGKMIVNMDEVKETRRQLKVHSLICPYCECVSLLPGTEKPKQRRRRSR